MKVVFRSGSNPTETVGNLTRLGLRDRGGKVQAYAVIDTSDLELVRSTGTAWTLMRKRHTNYVVNRIRTEKPQRTIYLHRLIMNPLPGLVVDHIDHDGLNNRRSNLRVVTTAQNNWNRGMQKGVTYIDDGKWRARLDMVFPTYDEALAARREWEEHFRLWNVAHWRPGK